MKPGQEVEFEHPVAERDRRNQDQYRRNDECQGEGYRGSPRHPNVAEPRDAQRNEKQGLDEKQSIMNGGSQTERHA